MQEDKLSFFYTAGLLDHLSSLRYYKERVLQQDKGNVNTGYYDKSGKEVPLEKLSHYYTAGLLEPNSSARYSKSR